MDLNRTEWKKKFLVFAEVEDEFFGVESAVAGLVL
jgi:hypothetical protein